ncbi:MAG: hypothetical protein O2971_18440, partial [Proteobacteria bacterium]|nr:hypothetical protein [Pseudomonadota bacterium]
GSGLTFRCKNRRKWVNLACNSTTGGSGAIKNLLLDYEDYLSSFKKRPIPNPVIILIDNDKGAAPIFAVLKEKFGITIKLSDKSDFYKIFENLYLVKTMELGKSGVSCIEDFYDDSLLKTVIGGKKFNPQKAHDAPGEYGKVIFANNVIGPNIGKIDFSKFQPLLNRIIAAINDYKKP